ncbi:MAG: hypothetical protein H0V29_07810, partial [Thermoleophilaceae bacterium]|nr:hypothetical protein [Thermoleophilaceae bacterium]
LRIAIGGIASDAARGSDKAVRAVLETGATAPSEGEPALRRAPVLGDLRERFPELAVWTAEAQSPGGAAEHGVSARLASAAGERTESAPWAYRVLLRRLAHEPGPRLSRAERIALSHHDATEIGAEGLPADALTLAALQTGVPVLAFDAAALEGELALRPAREGEEIDDEPLEEGEVVLADLERPLLVLFGPRVPDAMAGPDTERVVLAAIQAKGIAPVSVEEALWTSVEILRGA